MKIVIENTKLVNTGDAAILEGTIKICRIAFGPNTEIRIADQDPAVTKSLYPEIISFGQLTSLISKMLVFRIIARLNGWKNLYPIFSRFVATFETLYRISPILVPRKVRRAIQESSEADLRLTAGGTFISNHYGAYRIAAEFGKKSAEHVPLIFMTQTIESFENNMAFADLGKIMMASPLMLLRDETSEALVHELSGRADNIRVVPDAAFALAEPMALKARINDPRISKQPKIAISLRSWRFFKTRSNQEGMAAYKASVQRLATDLVTRHNAKLLFVSTCQGRPEYEYDDSAVAIEFVSELPEAVRAHITVDRDFRTPTGILGLLEDVDGVIATRMHMAILSLCKGLPVMPIAYERKTKDLFAKMGMNDIVLDIETMSPEVTSARLESFMKDLPSWRQNAAKETLKLHLEACQTARHLSQAWDRTKNGK